MNNEFNNELRAINQDDIDQGFEPMPIYDEPHKNTMLTIADEVEAAKLYYAVAFQRLPFEVTENGKRYETAHIFNPLRDERYIEYLHEINLHGSENEVESSIREASVKLWHDLIKEVENIEVEQGEDWKLLIDDDEKIEALNTFLAVSTIEPESVTSGKRKLSAKETQIVLTEAFFNGVPVQQKHILKCKTDEFTRQYDRLQARRYKQEGTKGLRRKPKVIYVPQDENLGKLYDEMFVSATGFDSQVIPLRFKTTALAGVFASKLDEKK